MRLLGLALLLTGCVARPCLLHPAAQAESGGDSPLAGLSAAASIYLICRF